MPIEPEAYLTLSVPERRKLVAEIKASVVNDLETLDAESADAMELRRRFAAVSGHPEWLPSWDEAKEFVLVSLRKEC